MKGGYGSLDTNDEVLKKAKHLADVFKERADKAQKSDIVPLQSKDLWGNYTENMKKLQRFNGQKAGQQLMK